MKTPPPAANSHHQSQCGYTLLEALLALSIFMVVVVPLLGRMVVSGGMTSSVDRIVAACLLEQSAAQIELHPEDVKPVETRTLGARQYQIRASATGTGLRQYRIEVTCRGRSVGEGMVYRRDEP